METQLESNNELENEIVAPNNILTTLAAIGFVTGTRKKVPSAKNYLGLILLLYLFVCLCRRQNKRRNSDNWV